VSRGGVSLTVLGAALALLLWRAPDIVFSVFAAILIALLLRAGATRLARHLRVPMALGVVLCALLAVAAVAVALYASAAGIGQQIDAIWLAVRRAAAALFDYLQKYDWARSLASGEASSEQVLASGKGLLGAAGSTATWVTRALTALVLLLLTGLFLALNPALYLSGLTRMFAPELRPRVRAALEEVGRVLRGWLFGQFIAMVFVGVVTGVGLWLLGVPLALGLGILSGLLTFIPVVGAVLTVIPALLLGFAQSPATALEVAGLYLGVHVVEGYVIEPYVQSQAIALPPAVALVALVLMTSLFGLAGAALAAPIAAAVLTLTRRAYVEGYLEGADGRSARRAS
jgi:predicted PurR-regulated permease PerM